MKKLNNRGFAVSTMLYGILTIIVLILMLLLNIMRSSYNIENATTDEICYYLNKCASKQIALETCYRTYNDNPHSLKSCDEEYNAYQKCTGKENSELENKKYLATAIKDKASVEGSSIIQDPTDANKYIYVGTNPSNYIKIGEKMGRIISLEANGKIKVILQESYNEPFDSAMSTSSNSVEHWENSTLYNTLKNKYNALPESKYYDKGKFSMAIMYNTESTKEVLDKINSNTDSKEGYFGLPTLEDYLKASSNIKTGSSPYCNLLETSAESINNAFTNCRSNNWMNKETNSWTSTGFAGINDYITYSSSEITSTTATNASNAHLIIYLKTNTTITAVGDGGIGNPYVLG